jgi:hypothetical protein
MKWSPDKIIERLERDRPSFHDVSLAGSRHLTTLGVDPLALDWIARNLNDNMITLETGAGNTTVVFAALAKDHYCFTHGPGEKERITEYLRSLDISSRVHFEIGPSDETLPRWNAGPVIDFAYIDGGHGYPLPALDWHYIDYKMLKIGGILGMDNTELRPVREHCEFLEENRSYKLVQSIYGGTFAKFYRKERDEFREWTEQSYSRRKKDPCDWKLSTRIRRHVSRWIKPYLW